MRKEKCKDYIYLNSSWRYKSYFNNRFGFYIIYIDAKTDNRTWSNISELNIKGKITNEEIVKRVKSEIKNNQIINQG